MSTFIKKKNKINIFLCKKSTPETIKKSQKCKRVYIKLFKM